MSTLHVSKFGQAGKGPVLALLHGWGSSSKIWQPCITQLAKEFHVWCVDLPGHGESSNIVWDKTVAQGVQLLKSALPERCILIGWSLGGLLAQLFSHQYPERVQGLMLVASTPKFVADKKWPHAMQVSTFNQFVKQYDASPQMTLSHFMALQALHGRSLKQIMVNLEQASLLQQPNHDLTSIRWGLEWLFELDLREAFAMIKLPIILFHGENDQVSPIKAAQQTVDSWQYSRLSKISCAGHVPFLSHPKEFIEQVKLMYAQQETESETPAE